MGTRHQFLRRLAALTFAATALAPAWAASAPSPPTTPAPAAINASPAGHSLTRGDLEPWLDGMIPYALQRGDAAGAVVAVVKDGQPILVKGYGLADVASGQRVDGDRTLFRPGSITKLFTWTAVMQLVGQGRIDLDRDVNAYLDFRIPARADGPITMRRLMTHTAGFEETIGNLASNDPKMAASLGDTLKRWTPTRIYPAGSTPAYSNYGAALAGYIVERVSGQPFDAYVEQHIFRPLGMDHSTLRQPLPRDFAEWMSKGYATASAAPKPYEIIGVPPAGSAATTGADMAKFMIAQLQDEGGANRLLRPEIARMMHRTYAPGLGPLNRMALGFYESNLNGREIISHAGDTQWFHSELDLFLDDHVGLYFSMNSLGKDEAGHQIRTALLQRFADRYFPATPATQTWLDPAAARAHAAMMAGSYENSRKSNSNFMSIAALLGQVQITADAKGVLSVSHITGLNGEPLKWREVSPFVWKDIAGPWRLAAQVRNGKVVRFSTDQFAPIMMFEPAPWWRSGAWLMPALLGAAAVLLLTLALWPIAALVRLRYRLDLGRSGSDALAYRLAGFASVMTLAVMAGWIGVVAAGVKDLALFSGPLNPWISLLGLAGPLVLTGAFAAVMWNAWRLWGTSPPVVLWASRIWALALVLAVGVMCWTTVAFHLYGPNTHF